MITRSPLVSREAERRELSAALARCRAGAGGLVLLTGDAGVGKSRLVLEALADWEGCTLRGAATIGGGPYAPIVDILRAVSDRFGSDALADHVKVLLPELAMPWREVDQAALVAAIQRTLRGIAHRQPTVVVLEDLHWAHAATVELLPGLAATFEHEPLLLVATYRSEGLARTHPVRAMRAELRRVGLLTEIALRPLDAGETGELLRGLLGTEPSPRLVAAVHDRAEGLPFVIEELAEAIDAGDLASDAGLPLPDSVVDAVLVRTVALRRQCEHAVEVAAVLGARVDLPVLADLVAAADVDRLLDDGLLREQGAETAVFRHEIVRDALYRSIPWARRREHHRVVAERLTTRGAAPETIAEHWLAAHDRDRARPLLLAAAERYCTMHAYRDAATLGRRALEIWPDGVDPDGRKSALERLAECAEMCGELESATATWAEVAASHSANHDLVRAGAAHRRLANAAGLMGDHAQATIAREAAAEAFATAGAHDDAAAEHMALASHLHSAAHLTRALEHAIAAVDRAELAGRIDLKAQALAVQGSVRTSLGQWQQGVDLARSGLELALAQELPEAAGHAYYELAGALIHAADYAASADAYKSASALCESHGVTDLAQACVACMSVAVRFLGDWDRALAIARDVLDDNRAPELFRMVAQEETGLITVLRGDRRRALGLLRRTAEFGRAAEVFGIEAGATWGLAVAAELDGDDAGAQRTIAGFLERCQAKEDWVFALPALRWAATFLSTLGKQDLLAQCHRLLAAAATRNSSPKVLSTLAHAGAELALLDGDPGQATALFGRAVELMKGIPAPFEQALSQRRWGAALARAGQRQSAVDTVTSAYRTARRLGAKPLARGCVTELAEMGERVDRRLGRLAVRVLEPVGLTRREKEVLHLLTGGRTNREIAQELFVSPRTVDMHVRNVLTKLDCSSRVAAVRRASELGLA